MWLRRLATGFGCLLCIATCCRQGATPPAVPASGFDDQAVSFARASTRFGLDLYRRLCAAAPGNLAIAPPSVGVALTMAWTGARGDTRDEIGRVLRLSGTTAEVASSARSLVAALNGLNGETMTLRVGNGLFAEQTYQLEPAFAEGTSQQFGAPVRSLDFIGASEESRRTINSAMADQTDQQIREILPAGSVNPQTSLVLTNAVYFVGRWLSPFEPRDTVPRDFFVNGQVARKVPTMSQTEQFTYTAGDGVQVLELAYEGNAVSMLLVLPDERNGLQKVEEGLTAERLQRWLSRLRATAVEVQLPRFELQTATELKQPLSQLGLKLAFDPDRADFRGMSSSGALYMQDVFHQVFVRVDEEGTRAAAATAVTMEPVSELFTETRFVADHPFLFAIIHRPSGTPLFFGRVVAPQS